MRPYRGDRRHGGAGEDNRFQVRAFNRQFGGQLPFDISRNPSERIFAAKGRPITKNHEMYFGPVPQKTHDSKYSTGWQTRNEWPYAYLERNLIRVSRHIWAMARLLADQQWIGTIAPMYLTNKMQFNIQTKIYSDDMADFIGLSGPVTEVATAIQEKQENTTYFGKGTSIHLNMMSSPEGVKDLWDKLMLVAMAINRTELYDFILTVRSMKDAKLEALKCPDDNMTKYYDTIKANWDCIRRREHGLEQLCEDVKNVSSKYHGFLNHMIVPMTMYSKLIFKSEHKDYYKKGPSTSGFDGKINSPSATTPDLFDKAQLFQDVKGFKVHLARDLQSQKYDLYRNVISRYTQIGTSHLIHPILDTNLSSPWTFRSKHLTCAIYDEDYDINREITYETCAKNSIAFKKDDGSIRNLETAPMYGYGKDRDHDLFVKKQYSNPTDYTENISLIGELNVHEKYAWDKVIRYCSSTMNNHFKYDGIKLNRSDIMMFERMFTYLEDQPFDNDWLTNLKELNWNAQMVLPAHTTRTHYSRTSRFFKVRQQVNTGSYILPGDKIGFGLANVWGVEAISKMDKSNLSSSTKDQWIVDAARRFMKVFRIHIDSLVNQLPDNKLIGKGFEKFSPSVFSYPKQMYNGWLNGINNTSNFLWFNWNPFSEKNVSDRVTDRNDANRYFRKFLEGIKNNAIAQKTFGVSATNSYNHQVLNGFAATAQLPVGFVTYIEDGGDTPEDNVDRTFVNRLQGHGYIGSGFNRDPSYDGPYGTHGLFKHIFEDRNVNNPYYPFLIYANASMRFLSRVSNININQVQQLSGIADLAGRNLSVNEFIDAVKESDFNAVNDPMFNVHKQAYFGEISKIRRHYNIYKNSRDVGRGLNQMARMRAMAQTTLTLNQPLSESISVSGVYEEVKQTKYNASVVMGTGRLDEEADHIEEFGLDDLRRENTQRLTDVLKQDRPSWPYHILHNLMLYRGVDDPTTITNEQFGTLSINNIAEFTKESGAKQLGGMCVKSIKDALYMNTNMFTRMNCVLLCLSDCTRNNLVGMYRNNACPPIIYEIFRPHMEYKTHPIIFIGNGAVFRTRGNPLFMMGLNPSTGILRFRYAQSGGTVPVLYENVYIQEDAIIVEAQGGAGTIFYDPDQFEKMGKNYYDPIAGVFGDVGQCSLFSVEVPLGYWFFKKVNTDITGHDQLFLKIGKNPSKILNEPPHYPLAYRFQTFWKRNRSNTSDAQHECANTLVCTGRTWYPDHNDDYKKDIASQGHWGKITFPGVRQYRIGNEHTPPQEKRIG